MNKYLQEAIKFRLGIFNADKEVDGNDKALDSITDINLNNLTYSSKVKGIPVSEIALLKQLRLLTLQNFELSEEDLKVLSSFNDLSTLHLVSCKIPDSVAHDFKKLQHIILVGSSFSKLPLVKMPRYVTIINKEGEEGLDLSLLPSIEDVHELDLLNLSSITNIDRVLEITNLKGLKLDGSQIDNEEVLKRLKPEVRVSHEEEFLYMR